jgi:chloramphenicol-sensitive protein RarD
VDEVVQASLGYFMNPLISVALGVIVLKERMRGGQWVAIGIAVIAVVILTINYGGIPWIALILGFSFGLYGLLKKQAGIASLPSLMIETVALFLPALIILMIGEFSGEAAFVVDGWWISVLLVLLGPVTALPLLAFGGAANRIPLSTLGVIQYTTPIMQFLLGVFVFGEVMTTGLWIGFILVWIALVIFTVDELRHAKKNSQLAGLEVTDPT